MQNTILPHNATKQEICDYYDSNPNLTLVELARLTNKPIPELKKILQEDMQ